MYIREITTQLEWEATAQASKTAEFLQSWQWGQFQAETDKKVILLGIYNEEGQLEQRVQGFVHELGFGLRYLYIPRVDVARDSTDLLKNYAKDKGYVFIRVESISKGLDDKGIVSAKNRQPKNTLVLNLHKDEDRLLNEMHQKTRYNIRLAEKKGVEIREGKDANIFWELNKETTARDTFKSHDKSYYAEMLKSPICHQLTAYYENKPIACNLYISFNGVCTYLHGASSNEYRNVMAPYLLQWTAIQFAKKFGCTSFDFWGIAAEIEKDNPNAICINEFCWNTNDAWNGITRFKVGFGGSRKSYPEAFDVVVNYWKYTLYRFVRRIM